MREALSSIFLPFSFLSTFSFSLLFLSLSFHNKPPLFRKIIDLENTVSAPGSMRETIRGTRKQPVSGGQDTFLRMAFMTMLLDIICDSK